MNFMDGPGKFQGTVKKYPKAKDSISVVLLVNCPMALA